VGILGTDLFVAARSHKKVRPQNAFLCNRKVLKKQRKEKSTKEPKEKAKCAKKSI